MKLRFLAAAGNAGPRIQLAARLKQKSPARLTEPHSLGCVTIWTERGTPLLKNENGTAAAVGLIRDRSADIQLKSLPHLPGLERILVRDFWGAYVLFTAGETSHAVLRDPSGTIPVYYGAAGPLFLYASDAEMLRLAWAEPFQPDLDTVHHWLRYPYQRTARTGARGVQELLPGLAHEQRQNEAAVRQYWFPQYFVAPGLRIMDFGEAADMVREEVLRSVPPLVSGQEDVVLLLSGGLDSSILAAALAHAGIGFRGITFATRSAEGDERSYARLIARHFGIDLQEITEDDLDFAGEAPSSPLQLPLKPVHQAMRSAELAAAGADALLLDGGGGDNLFAAINTPAPAIDALRQCGIAEAIKVLCNVSLRHECTFWKAAIFALRRARRPPLRWPVNDSFLGPSSIKESLDQHPWLSSSDQLPLGCAEHLRMIVGVYHFLLDPAPGEPFNLHPLINQRILEMCLRIPSWLWLENGRDRAVARAAFRGLVPNRILDRRGKGSLQSIVVKNFAERRRELRDSLASGRLAAERIIDGDAIAAHLNSNMEAHDLSYGRILDIASAEQWLRSFG